MACLRLLLAALLLVAFTLGVASHTATAHGFQHLSEPQVAHLRHHDQGEGTCCPDGHKLSSHETCQIACSAAVALPAAPAELGARFTYIAQFGFGSSAPMHETMRVPDLFPPKRTAIA